MDIQKVIEELYAERERLDRVIQSLESLYGGVDPATGEPKAPRRRGRKSMSQEERLAVSRRMRAYWAKRRKK